MLVGGGGGVGGGVVGRSKMSEEIAGAETRPIPPLSPG